MVAVQGAEWGEQGHDMVVLFCPEDTSKIQDVGTAGGLCLMAHPGRYTWTIQQYVDLYKTYPHLIGQEVYNGADRYPGDRILWDQVLFETMPLGRPAWGFSNDDTHGRYGIGRNWSVLLMPEMTSNAVYTALRKGMFFFVYAQGASHPTAKAVAATQALHSNEVTRVPKVTGITADAVAGTIRIEAANQDKIEWWYNDKVLCEGAVFNLSSFPDISYVRAMMYSPDRVVVLGTQPFGIRPAEAGQSGKERRTP
jgi:hypothetical protein